jgi:hypothetical protein
MRENAMLVRERMEGSDGAGWQRCILGVSRALLGAALLMASLQHGNAQEIEVHHTIKTEYPRKDPDRKKIGDQSFTFSPDGKTLAFHHGGYPLVLWDLEKNKPRMAAGAWRLIVWDPDTGKERIVEHYGKRDERALKWIVKGMAFSADGKTLVTSTWDGIRFLDVAACRDKGIEVGNRIESMSRMCLTSDDRTLVMSLGVEIHLWDIKRDRMRLKIRIKWSGDLPVSIAPDTHTLAVVTESSDESIELWNFETGKRQAILKYEQRRYGEAVISPDGKIVAGTHCGRDYIDLWDVASKTPTTLSIIPPKSSNGVERMMFSPDSRTLAVLERDGRLSLWEVVTGTKRATLPGKTHVPDMEFSPDGRFLAVGAERSIQFWDLAGVKRKPPDAAETARLWRHLGSADAELAFGAVRTLAAFPSQALPLLRKELRPRILSESESKKIDRLLIDLDDDAFAAREKASKALKHLGMRAEAMLHHALGAHPSPEVRRRLRQLVEDIERDKVGSDLIEYLRAVEVLEHIGTPEAAAVLEELAQRGCNVPLRQEAKSSLARLKKRPIAKH